MIFGPLATVASPRVDGITSSRKCRETPATAGNAKLRKTRTMRIHAFCSSFWSAVLSCLWPHPKQSQPRLLLVLLVLDFLGTSQQGFPDSSNSPSTFYHPNILTAKDQQANQQGSPHIADRTEKPTSSKIFNPVQYLS